MVHSSICALSRSSVNSASAVLLSDVYSLILRKGQSSQYLLSGQTILWKKDPVWRNASSTGLRCPPKSLHDVCLWKRCTYSQNREAFVCLPQCRHWGSSLTQPGDCITHLWAFKRRKPLIRNSFKGAVYCMLGHNLSIQGFKYCMLSTRRAYKLSLMTSMFSMLIFFILLMLFISAHTQSH